jgi:hypothetical protein
MDAAFRLELSERQARALDMRAAMADADGFKTYMERLKPKR